MIFFVKKRRRYNSKFIITLLSLTATDLRPYTSVDGGVFRRQPKRVPSHRVYDVVSPHLVVVGHRVADGVDPDVAHVQLARRVREHGQHVHRLRGDGGGTEEITNA
jgi:hypothetical protein